MNSRKSLTHLIEQAKQGSSNDLDELFTRFQPLILKLVKKMNVQYREDAKQELMMELFEAIQRFEQKQIGERKS